jgi:hypothetical protein
MKSFHIDLSHIEDSCGIWVKFRSHKLKLQTHDATTMAEARKLNSALAALPLETCIQRFTHFVNVPEEAIPTDRISWIRTLAPPQDPTIPLPTLITMSIYIPEGYQQASFRKVLQARSTYFPAVLKYYGLDERTATALSLDTLIAVNYLVTPMSTASALLQMHPQLSSLQPHVCHVLSSQHVLPDPSINPDQYNYVSQLSNAIADPNNQPWAPVVPCTNHDDSTATAQFALNTSGKGYKTGDTLYRRDLHPTVLNWCTNPLGGAIQTASDDSNLQNQTWSVQHGTPVIHTEQPQSTTHSPQPETVGDLLGNWAVNPTGMNFGLWLDVELGASSDQLFIAPGNLFMRTLSASIQYLDESGNPIGQPTSIGGVPAAFPIMGLPVPDTSILWTVDMKGYSRANLIFGSLGRNLDVEASPPGALATGLFQILLPTIFFVAGTGLGAWKVNTSVQTIVKQSLLALFKAAGPIAGWISSGKPPDSSQFFSFMANLGIGLFMQIRSAQIQSLATEVAEEVGEEELAETAAPDGGISIRLMSAILYGIQMGQTVIEVAASPAVMTVNFQRSCVATLTLIPDPAHGEAGKSDTAVWPAVADHYEVLLKYKTSGTTLSTTGTMQPTTNGDPITVTFDKVAAGSQVFIQIQANFYSSTGWLCGYWQSDWISVQDNGSGSFNLGSHAITEVLVPLTQDSQYQFKEKIVYQITNGKGNYVWQAQDANHQPLPPPSTTPANSVCQLVGMTLNTSAFQVGYIWRSAGQNLPLDGPNNPPSSEQEYVIKNLSVLGTPGSGLKTSLIGFLNKPAIGYSPVDSTPTHPTIDQRNFILDPRTTDSNNPKLHLRQVTLDDGTNNFGLTANPLWSWGYFPIANLDAIAMHPDNAVVGISYIDNKLLILNLTDAHAADEDAPQAAVLSGKGLRQGLLMGPKALTITADGRILILESINTTDHPPRVQAFDLKGNPVACFGNKQPDFSIPTTDGGAAFAAAMDQGKTVPDALQTSLQQLTNLYTTFLLELDSSLSANLDAGSFQAQDDPIITVFAYQGITITIDSSNLNDHTVSSYITVNTPGSSWTITDPVQTLQYQILKQDQNDLYVFQMITQFQTRAIAPGQHWTLYDIYAALTYDIRRNTSQAEQFDVTVKHSFFSVQPTDQTRANTTSTFLDLAVESKGFIYVLSYINDGNQPTDYYLDLYDPTGNYLSTVPDSTKTSTPQNIVAGKITVDKFRNLFSLNYETIANPPAGPEPSVSHWEPTTPLFSIPPAKPDPDDPTAIQAAQEFASSNISVVKNYFSKYGKISLNYSTTSITTLSSAGFWAVKDSSQNASYQVVWSGDNLLAYEIPV